MAAASWLRKIHSLYSVHVSEKGLKNTLRRAVVLTGTVPALSDNCTVQYSTVQHSTTTYALSKLTTTTTVQYQLLDSE